jgi:transcriptional regulator with XRE-family HTH domain
MTDYGVMENELAHRLIKARSGHGWSQADLSEVSGVAAAQISRYESGRAKPRPEVVAKLAKSLAVGFEWLAYGTGDIDDGSEVPRYPASQKPVYTLDLGDDEELRSTLEELAQHYGLTLQMAVKTALLEAVKGLKKEGLKDPSENPRKPKS